MARWTSAPFQGLHLGDDACQNDAEQVLVEAFVTGQGNALSRYFLRFRRDNVTSLFWSGFAAYSATRRATLRFRLFSA